MSEPVFTFDIYYEGRRIGSVDAHTRYQAVDEVSNRYPAYDRRFLKAVRRYV